MVFLDDTISVLLVCPNFSPTVQFLVPEGKNLYFLSLLLIDYGNKLHVSQKNCVHTWLTYISCKVDRQNLLCCLPFCLICLKYAPPAVLHGLQYAAKQCTSCVVCDRMTTQADSVLGLMHCIFFLAWTVFFRVSHKWKFRCGKLGDQGGYSTLPICPNHLPSK